MSDADDDSFNDEGDLDEQGFHSDDSFNDAVDEDGDVPLKASAGGNGTGPSKLAAEVTAARRGDYVILNEQELRAAMDALTKDVATVLHVPSPLASMLLRTHNWTKEKFVATYFEDPERLLLKNGLQYMAEDGELGASPSGRTVGAQDERDVSSLSSSSSAIAAGSSRTQTSKAAPHSSSLSSSPSMSMSASASAAAASSSASAAAPAASSPSPPSSSFTCPVCYDDFPFESTLALGCGHRFCRTCWTTYLNTAVADGKLCIVSRCAGFKCPVLVPDQTFKNLTEPAVFEKHQHYLLRSYVEDNRLLRWCPAQRCNLAVRVFNSALLAVKCRCGHSFCFQCAEESHAPVTCAQLAAWNDKCKNESETAHWIIANTKKCPKCGVRIEKSQGCNHMTCRSCKFEWCWVCNGDWQQHGNHTGGYYKCNRWDPKAKPDAAAAAAAAAGGTAASAAANAEQAKAELNRYLHYYQRFHNHDQSKRFAERQRLQTDRRMASLHAQSGGDAAWIEFEFLASATAQVLECRNVLKYTYVFAYYLPDGPEKTLFEFLQQQLEAATEHLSELSELPPLDKLDRAQIINYTRITQQFCTNLINGVQNGLTPAA